MGRLKTLLGKPDQDDFARMMMKALRDNGEKNPVSYDPDGFKLTIAGDAAVEFFLHNAYRDYLQSPRRRRQEVLHQYLRATVEQAGELPVSLDEAIADILPVVRSRSYYELTSLHLRLKGLAGLDSPYRPIATNLALGLCHDGPDTVKLINTEHLTNWKVPFEELLARAKDNLWQRTTNQFHSPRAGVFVSPYHDCHDAARLLFWELIIQNDVRGAPVVAVPDRDTLIVTGSEDQAGLEYMVSACRDALDNPRLVSTKPLLLENGTWTEWELPEAHPLYPRFRMCEVKEKQLDYSQQKGLLEARYERTGEDVFVASFTAFEKTDSGQVLSYCVWGEEIVSDLPRTDLIVFMRDAEHILGRGPWPEAQAAFGELMKKNAEYPERYRVESFPSSEQLARIPLDR